MKRSIGFLAACRVVVGNDVSCVCCEGDCLSATFIVTLYPLYAISHEYPYIHFNNAGKYDMGSGWMQEEVRTRH
jgi:hypothetical protein